VAITTLQAHFPFYHSTDDIGDIVRELSQTCSVPFTFKSESCGNDCRIDIVDIGNVSSSEKVFLLFGEHARELISPETAIRLMHELCRQDSSPMIKAALSVGQFRLIPNGNPTGRRQVEFGKYCLRTNLNGVDLNRNWDAHWNPTEPPYSSESDQLDPGSHAFSEMETRIFQKAVVEFRPTVFASIHSGTLGMYMPWAYSDKAGIRGIRNYRKMSQVLAELDDKYCNCPSGAAAEQVGYDSPGTCLDWVHSKTTSRYSYAFEIYTSVGVEGLRQRYSAQRLSRESSFMEMSLEDQQFSTSECFSQFNPTDAEKYQQVVGNWSHALIELALITHRK
jgi:hypothetical protein